KRPGRSVKGRPGVPGLLISFSHLERFPRHVGGRPLYDPGAIHGNGVPGSSPQFAGVKAACKGLRRRGDRMDRVRFLVSAGAALGAAALPRLAYPQTTVTLPMQNGVRPLVAFPQKRPLILLTPRPPQLETPMAVFDEGVFTPNDAFYVRWHLSNIPQSVDASTHRIAVSGAVQHPLSLSLGDLAKMPTIEIAAVNQ